MDKSALSKSILFGSLLQIVMVLIGKFVPSVGSDGNFYPIVGSTVAALAGVRFSKLSSAGSMGTALAGGAVAGGVSSLIGSALAGITGQAPGALAQVIAIATGTGAAAGIVGGLVGRFLPKAKPV
jgi:hypothetical protein